MAFGELENHDSTPSVPLTDVQKVRFSELAKDLADTKIQAYIEANFGIKALDLLKSVVALIGDLA